MSMLTPQLTELIRRHRDLDPHDRRLLLDSDGNLQCHYAPFDHINPSATVVLVGITPGAQQAANMLAAMHRALQRGESEAQALKEAKAIGSFSGALRSTLVNILDHVGMHTRLGLDSCARLFDRRTDLVHYTSALRYPVFVGDKDYSGNPGILRTPFLRSMSDRWLAEEASMLQNAFWIPLGKEPTDVLRSFVARSMIPADRVLDGLPHPSGQNGERVAYFLGRKPRELLSQKTNADKIDQARARMIEAVSRCN